MTKQQQQKKLTKGWTYCYREKKRIIQNRERNRVILSEQGIGSVEENVST